MRNIKFLHLIIAVSLLTAVSLYCFVLFFLSPSFTNLIIKTAEIEAIKIGRHLSAQFNEVRIISKKLPAGFVEATKLAITDFGLMKIKVFAPDGEIVFSSAEKDIGTINKKDYFHNIVAKGGVFTKMVQKDTKSLEDQVVRVDVVETYVPVMFEGNFAGAFEIYFDITDNKNELESLLFRTNSLMLLIAVGLMFAVLVIFFIARRSFIEQEQAEEKIIQQSIDLQGKNNELLVLNEVSRVLSESLDMKTLLPLVLEKVVNGLPILHLQKKGGIMLVDGEKMNLVAHLGHDDTFMKIHEDVTIHDCLCGLAVRSGEIVVSRNSHDDSRHTICYDAMQPHGHIIVPIKSSQKVVGVLYLYLPAGIEVGEFNRSLLESIASQIGMAVENAMLFGEAKRLSLHDPLTGLANRRLMFISLNQSLTLAERYRKPLCVSMFDIDYFKKYNDTKGHDAGDKALVEVANEISRGVRESDLVVRYGGEEFLLILPESGMKVALQVVERIRKSIEQNLDVTVSAGVALHKKGSSVEELVKAADLALYKAKENGRNRVECA